MTFRLEKTFDKCVKTTLYEFIHHLKYLPKKLSWESIRLAVQRSVD